MVDGLNVFITSANQVAKATTINTGHIKSLSVKEEGQRKVIEQQGDTISRQKESIAELEGRLQKVETEK